MNQVESLIRGFKRIRLSDSDLLRSYFTTMKTPRYFCSMAVLATNPFYFKVQDGVLLVMKRQWISGYPIIYLSQPPLSLNDNKDSHKLEREIVDAFAGANIPTRMTTMDAIRLDMGYTKLAAKGKDYVYDLTGANDNRKHRYIKRLTDRLIESNRLLVQQRVDGVPSESMMTAALSVVEKWHVAHNESPMRTIMKLKQFKDIASNTSLMLSVSYLDGIPIDCTLSELYASNKGVYVFGYYDPAATPTIKDWARFEYIVDNDYWLSHSSSALFASGGIRDGSKKLAYAKQKIDPVMIEAIYQQADVPRFEADIYHLFGEDKKGNLVFKEQLK